MKRTLAGALALGLLLAFTVSAIAQEPPVVPPKKVPVEIPKKGIVDDLKLKVKQHHYHVKYLCPTWKTKCFKTIAEAKAFQKRLQDAGFQTVLHQHNGLYCIHYRLTQWRQRVFIGVGQHAAAHAFENWLKGIGCQTQFIHH
jgi:hypothetical protein